MKDEQRNEFEAHAKRAFDASVAALDARTRSKLARARHRALESARTPGVLDRLLGPRRPRALVPAGLAAAALVAAWLAWRPPTAETGFEAASVSDLEILLGEEDLEMIEDLEFYAWLEEHLDAPADDAGDDIG